MPSMKKISTGPYKSCSFYIPWLITSPAAPMIMVAHEFNTAITLTGFCLSFLFLISANSAGPSCKGPTQYYAEIGCTPVFKDSNSTCPEKYNCDHLKNLRVDKCHINGHEYAIGEMLRDEDKNPCDIGCFCSQGHRGPEFTCAIVDCFNRPKPGCYLKRNATSCCGGPEVCQEDRPTCIVDGRILKDGDYFNPASEPGKHCYCGEGYTGENIEPFCVSPKTTLCGTMLRHIGDIRENCVPTYYHEQSPKTDCSVAYRCQNDKDAVIPRESIRSDESNSASSEPADPGLMCSFGNLKMRVDDELNQGTDYSSVCVKCVCEVPPVPTCQRLSDEECDVTEHPDFGIP